VALFIGGRLVTDLFTTWPVLREVARLAVLAVIGAVIYGGMALALFGKDWWVRK